MEQTIKLSIQDKDFYFEMTTENYNEFINSLEGNNRVDAAHNTLVRVVKKEQKDDLLKILEYPGAPVQIMTVITKEFVTDLNVHVGK